MAVMKAVWSFFIAALLTIGCATVLVGSSGLPFEASLAATIANFSTAGPVYTSGWASGGAAPWPGYDEFSTFAKYVLMVVMLLGRLEVLAIVGLISTRYWRNR